MLGLLWIQYFRLGLCVVWLHLVAQKKYIRAIMTELRGKINMKDKKERRTHREEFKQQIVQL
jgi:hypothetical protein